MKNLKTLMFVTGMAFSLMACNENNADDRRDYNSSAQMLQRDDASIEATREQIEQDRAEKADAKARGDMVDQAASSLKIGAGHVASGAKKTKRAVDEKIHEKHEQDLDN